MEIQKICSRQLMQVRDMDRDHKEIKTEVRLEKDNLNQ
jgi:hypothetical protein